MLNEEIIEDLVIEEIIRYLNKLIALTLPIKVFIAMDGTVPLEKIQMKRENAHLSDYLETVWEKLYPRDTEESENESDIYNFNPGKNNVGTNFMKKVVDKVNLAIVNKRFGEVEVIFSDFYTPHEGEHKIMNYIKSSHFKKISIFGNDNDLLMLSFLIKNKNIIVFSNNKNYYYYYDIRKLSWKIYDKIKVDANLWEIMRDFVFLNFFSGNDYVIKLASIPYNNGCFESLIFCYNHIYRKIKEFFIIGTPENPIINQKFFSEFFLFFSQDEAKKLVNNLNQYRENSKKDKDWLICGIENLPDDYIKFKNQYRPIDYTKPNWNKKYNSIFFQNNKELACRNYLESIIFCFNLYMKGKTSWHWMNKYFRSPLASDLYSYLQLNYINEIILEENNFFTPLEQTMFIIPKSCFHQYASNFHSIIEERLNDDSFRIFYPELEEMDLNGYEVETIGSIRLKMPQLNLQKYRQVSDEFYSSINYNFTKIDSNNRNPFLVLQLDYLLHNNRQELNHTYFFP